MESNSLLWQEAKAHASNYDIIWIHSVMAKPLISASTFAPLDQSLIKDISKVSIDFSHTEYDPNFEYLIPINWGINGFLWKQREMGLPPTNLNLALKNPDLKGKIFLLPDEIELYQLMLSQNVFSSDIFMQERWDELMDSSEKFFDQVRVSPDSAKEIWNNQNTLAMQISNGKASELVSTNEKPDFVFWLPEDKMNLWISFIGISRESNRKEDAYRFIAYLLEDSSIETMVKLSGEASTINQKSEIDIGPMQKPNYLRKIDLSKIKIATDITALMPAWHRNLNRLLPEVFRPVGSSEPYSKDMTSNPLTKPSLSKDPSIREVSM